MRFLRADEIEVRVGGVYQKGVQMLLFKNARVDMQILDETFGEMNWQRDHKEVKGNMFCGIGVLNEASGDWVWKWDCGTESNTEKEKGEASDSFKRAGTNWGIGRELYNSPFIWINAPTQKKANGYGFELTEEGKKMTKGLSVSRVVTEEINGIPTVVEVEIAKDGNPIKTYRKEK